MLASFGFFLLFIVSLAFDALLFCRSQDNHTAGSAQQNPAQTFIRRSVQQQFIPHYGCQ